MLRSNINEFDNIITVLVGAEERHFTLHQDLVCNSSKFFRAACSETWLEGQEKLVRLPETDPDVFQEYCKWTYSGSIRGTTCTAANTQEQKNAELKLLVRMYLLGDLLDDLKLRNRTFHELLHGMTALNRVPSAKVLTSIWNATTAGSLFRKMLVDVTIAREARTRFAADVSVLPPSMSKRLPWLLCETFSRLLLPVKTS